MFRPSLIKLAILLLVFCFSRQAAVAETSSECSSFGQLLQLIGNGKVAFDDVVRTMRTKSRTAEAIMLFSRAPERTSFFNPRTLISPVSAFWNTGGIKFSKSNELNDPYWNGRLFVASVRHRLLTAPYDDLYEDHRLEVISWNKKKASFEFYIVDNLGSSSTARIIKRDTECRTCHSAGPIFLQRGWDGSDADDSVFEAFVVANALADAKKFSLQAYNCIPEERQRNDIARPSAPCPSKWIFAAYRLNQFGSQFLRLSDLTPEVQKTLPKIGSINAFGKANTGAATSAVSATSSNPELTILDFELATTIGAFLEDQVRLWSALPPFNRVQYTSAMIKNFLVRDILSTASEADPDFFKENRNNFAGDLQDLRTYLREKLIKARQHPSAVEAQSNTPSAFGGANRGRTPENAILLADPLANNPFPNDGTNLRAFNPSFHFRDLDIAIQNSSIDPEEALRRSTILDFDRARPQEGANNFNLPENLHMPAAAPKVKAGNGSLLVGELPPSSIRLAPDLDIFGFNRESVQYLREAFAKQARNYLSSCKKKRIAFGAPRPPSLEFQPFDPSPALDPQVIQDLIIESLDQPSMRQLYRSVSFPGRTEIMEAFIKSLGEVAEEAKNRCYCSAGLPAINKKDLGIRPNGCGVHSIDTAVDVTAGDGGALCKSCHSSPPGQSAAAPQAGFDVGSMDAWSSISQSNKPLSLRWLLGVKALKTNGLPTNSFLGAGETESGARPKNHGSIEYICSGDMPPDPESVDSEKLRSLTCHLINLCANNPSVVQKAGGNTYARKFCLDLCSAGQFRESLPCK